MRYVLKDANEKVFLGYSKTRLENPAITKKLLDTIAEAEKDLKRCEGDTVPMEQKYSYGSGRRSRRELLGRLLCIKSLVIRRSEAKAEKDMTIRCGMVDDCYVEKFDVACWHRRGCRRSSAPSNKMRIGTNCKTSHDDTKKFTVSRHEERILYS